ncbi:hypothetical protein [Streptococcus suis]|uniref:hypothetical protein n=1 Tax=Streptococcus suis TaxID=1307 RepID=UPI0009A17173
MGVTSVLLVVCLFGATQKSVSADEIAAAIAFQEVIVNQNTASGNEIAEEFSQMDDVPLENEKINDSLEDVKTNIDVSNGKITYP